MSYDHPNENLSRDSIFKVLWDDDLDRLGRSKMPVRLDRGDEFVDLQLLERGVQRAISVMVPTGGVLARKAVEAHTWSRILEQLRPAASSREA